MAVVMVVGRAQFPPIHPYHFGTPLPAGVRCVQPTDVFVVQDGTNPEVQRVLDTMKASGD